MARFGVASPELAEWHVESGLYAGGFRPGDIVINTFLYHLVPAAHEMDEARWDRLMGVNPKLDISGPIHEGGFNAFVSSGELAAFLGAGR